MPAASRSRSLSVNLHALSSSCRRAAAVTQMWLGACAAANTEGSAPRCSCAPPVALPPGAQTRGVQVAVAASAQHTAHAGVGVDYVVVTPSGRHDTTRHDTARHGTAHHCRHSRHSRQQLTLLIFSYKNTHATSAALPHTTHNNQSPGLQVQSCNAATCQTAFHSWVLSNSSEQH
jgi:hypothetical protein